MMANDGDGKCAGLVVDSEVPLEPQRVIAARDTVSIPLIAGAVLEGEREGGLESAGKDDAARPSPE